MTLKSLFHFQIDFTQQLSSFTPARGAVTPQAANQPVTINRAKGGVGIISLVVGQKLQLSGNLAALSKVSDTP